MTDKVIRIGTRDSELALWQANTVKDLLEALGNKTVLVPVKSTGDLVLDKPLHELGITGIFTKTLDVAMLKGEMGELRGELRTEMSELRVELTTDMSELRSEFRELRSELKSDLLTLEARLDTRFEERFSEARALTVRLFAASITANAAAVVTAMAF